MPHKSYTPNRPRDPMLAASDYYLQKLRRDAAQAHLAAQARTARTTGAVSFLTLFRRRITWLLPRRNQPASVVGPQQ